MSSPETDERNSIRWSENELKRASGLKFLLPGLRAYTYMYIHPLITLTSPDAVTQSLVSPEP